MACAVSLAVATVVEVVGNNVGQQWISCGSDHSLKRELFLQTTIRRKQGVTLDKNPQILKLLQDNIPKQLSTKYPDLNFLGQKG